MKYFYFIVEEHFTGFFFFIYFLEKLIVCSPNYKYDTFSVLHKKHLYFAISEKMIYLENKR